METTKYFCSKSRRMRKIIFGLMLIAAGVLLLGFNAGFIDTAYRPIIFSWQMLLIAIGILNLFRENGHWFSGLVLIIVGGFFLLPHLFFLPTDFSHEFWPALLIIIGILVIARRTLFHSHFHHSHHRYYESNGELRNEAGFIEWKNVFSGGKHKGTSN